MWAILGLICYPWPGSHWEVHDSEHTIFTPEPAGTHPKVTRMSKIEPNNRDLEDPRDQSPEKANEDGNSSRLGSESNISNLMQMGIPRMSRLHEIAFVLTICTAQIMALAGVGQALGEFGGNQSCAELIARKSTIIHRRKQFLDNKQWGTLLVSRSLQLDSGYIHSACG